MLSNHKCHSINGSNIGISHKPWLFDKKFYEVTAMSIYVSFVL